MKPKSEVGARWLNRENLGAFAQLNKYVPVLRRDLGLNQYDP